MPTATQKQIGICLFELPDKDQAVIQRVISFSTSQGKDYVLKPEINQSNIIITLDNIDLPAHNALTIRIGEAESLHNAIALKRPLLVTRVMRTLDDAVRLLGTQPQTPPTEIQQPTEAPATSKDIVVETTTETQTEALEELQETPEPEVAESLPLQHDVHTEHSADTASTPTVNASTDKDEGAHQHLALVVDDSAAIRKQLEIELRDAQIKADFAETGEEALEKSARQDYDLVFLDIVMPGIDGYEVCRQMRARKSMKKIPIIMLSGKTSPLDEVQGVIAGASTYLTKPVKHEQFQETLKRVSKWLTNFAR